MMYEKEIKKLKMTPEKWGKLDELLSSEEYHRVMMDYQRREFLKLPKCNSIFGVCRFHCAGRCNSKGRCSLKIS